MNLDAREHAAAEDVDRRADAAAWLDEDPRTIAALARGVDDDLLPEREQRRRGRGRAYSYVSRGRS